MTAKQTWRSVSEPVPVKSCENCQNYSSSGGTNGFRSSIRCRVNTKYLKANPSSKGAFACGYDGYPMWELK